MGDQDKKNDRKQQINVRIKPNGSLVPNILLDPETLLEAREDTPSNSSPSSSRSDTLRTKNEAKPSMLSKFSSIFNKTTQ